MKKKKDKQSKKEPEEVDAENGLSRGVRKRSTEGKEERRGDSSVNRRKIEGSQEAGGEGDSMLPSP